MTPKHTLIYPQKQDAGRAQSRPPGATMGGPVPNGPRSQARASSGPCPASQTAFPLEGDPRPSRAEAGKSLRLPRFQDLPKTNYRGTYPKLFHFYRAEFRWDFIPGRDHISVRLPLGLRKLLSHETSCHPSPQKQIGTPAQLRKPTRTPLLYSRPVTRSPRQTPEGAKREEGGENAVIFLWGSRATGAPLSP